MPTPPSPITVPTSLSYRSTIGRNAPLTNLELDGNFAYLENLAEQKLPISTFNAENIISTLNASALTASPGGINSSLLRGYAPTSSNLGNSIVLRNSSGDFYANIIYATTFSGTATDAISAQKADKLNTAVKINGVSFDGTQDITVSDNSKVSKSGDTLAGKLTLPAATTTYSSLNAPHGTEPSAPSNGDIWTTVNGQFNRIAGVTKRVAYFDSDISGRASNVTGVVQVSNGGTGSSNADVARSNLGAASAGNNDDITKLSGLTTPLSANQGGTGLTTSGAIGNVLTSDGNGMWISAAPAGVPSGAIMLFAMQTPPNGWLECDGRTLSRAVYPSLFNAIGTTYGVNKLNPGQTFNIPDLRGEFVRGWDNNRGVDPGRKFGSFQNFDWKSLWLTNTLQNTSSGYSHNDVWLGKSTVSYTGNLFTGHWRNPSASIGGKWGNEEPRPRNVALMYCIKI